MGGSCRCKVEAYDIIQSGISCEESKGMPPHELHSLDPQQLDTNLSPLFLQDSELLYEVEVAGPPLCVALNGPDGGA